MKMNCDTHGYVNHDPSDECIACNKAAADSKRGKFLQDRSVMTIEKRLVLLESDLYDLRLKKLSSIVFG